MRPTASRTSARGPNHSRGDTRTADIGIGRTSVAGGWLGLRPIASSTPPPRTSCGAASPWKKWRARSTVTRDRPCAPGTRGRNGLSPPAVARPFVDVVHARRATVIVIDPT